MNISSRTREGSPIRCPVCGSNIRIEPSSPPGDAPCPNGGSLLWFAERVLGHEHGVQLNEPFVRELAATTAPAAICEIVHQLVITGAIDRANQHDIEQALLKREELGSTAIGKGIAVPHARHACIERPIGTVAFSRAGIDFSSLVRHLVSTVFLFLSSVDRPSDHLRALQMVARFAQSLPRNE